MKHVFGIGLVVAVLASAFWLAKVSHAEPPPPGFVRVTKVDDGGQIEVYEAFPM